MSEYVSVGCVRASVCVRECVRGVRRKRQARVQAHSSLLNALFLAVRCAALYIFADVEEDTNFKNLEKSYISLFVLMTTANFPDVMMPGACIGMCVLVCSFSMQSLARSAESNAPLGFVHFVVTAASLLSCTTDTHRQTQTDTHTDTHRHTHTDTDTHRHTQTHTDTHTHRHTHTHKASQPYSVHLLLCVCVMTLQCIQSTAPRRSSSSCTSSLASTPSATSSSLSVPQCSAPPPARLALFRRCFPLPSPAPLFITHSPPLLQCLTFTR